METERVIERQQINITEQDVEQLPNANELSREALVKMLIEKGGCTTDEMSKLEDRVQEEKSIQDKFSFVQIKDPYNRGRFPGLKKMMSKHRWSRKLGTWLFGWKWKKIKTVSSFS